MLYGLLLLLLSLPLSLPLVLTRRIIPLLLFPRHISWRCLLLARMRIRLRLICGFRCSHVHAPGTLPRRLGRRKGGPSGIVGREAGRDFLMGGITWGGRAVVVVLLRVCHFVLEGDLGGDSSQWGSGRGVVGARLDVRRRYCGRGCGCEVRSIFLRFKVIQNETGLENTDVKTWSSSNNLGKE